MDFWVQRNRRRPESPGKGGTDETDMKSFDDIQYQRVDISAVKACIKESCAMLKKAARFSDVKQAVLKNSQCEGKLDTMFLVAGIRREMQPGGAFYEMELEFYLREIPRLAKLQEKFAQGILDSRYLVEIEKEFGEGYVRPRNSAGGAGPGIPAPAPPGRRRGRPPPASGS